MQANYIVGFSTWGSVLAGLVVFFMAQLGFTLLGLGLGLTPVKPRADLPGASKIAGGAGAWMGITGLISMFLGAWVASHHAGDIGVVNSVIHGILTWAVAGLVILSTASTAVGSLVGGIFGTLMGGIRSAAGAAGGAAQGATGAAGEGMKQNASPGERLRQEWPKLREQFESALRQTGKPELQPEHMKAEAQRTSESAKNQASQGNTEALFRQIMSQMKGSTQSVDKNAVANVIEQRTHMSHQQAVATADQWVSQYRRTVGTLQQKVQEVGEKTETAAKTTAHVIGISALWTFVLYILSLGVAMWGGWAGAIR